MVGFALGRLTLYCVVVVFVYAAMWRQCADTPPLFLLEELSRPARFCVLQPEALVFFLLPPNMLRPGSVCEQHKHQT